MQAEANKELVRQFYEAIQQEDYDALKEFCHPRLRILSSSRYAILWCTRPCRIREEKL